MMAARDTRDLHKRVAIVTGATSGIGEATAMLLHANGAVVLATGRNRRKLDELASKGLAICEMSLLDAEAASTIFKAARTLGPVSILVHSAGRPGYLDQPIFDQTQEGWRETLHINLDIPFALSQLVSRDIRDQNWGRIVMVSSTAGEKGAPAMAPYCASKHGVIGLMRSIAQDIAPCNGTCNAVLPSWVRTEMAERDAEAEAQRRNMTVAAVWAERARSNPAGRILSAADVARVIGFLVSKDAQGINGEAVNVTMGGLW